MGTAVKKVIGWLRAVGRPLYRAWMRFARLLARVNTFLLMAFSFYVLVLPIGVLRRFVAGREPKGWIKREPLAREHYRKQY